jgi:6-phospho-beta-glucosidase
VKIAIIGGAGVRTPLLVNGLAQSDLPIEEIGLFDIDQTRLAVIGSVATAYASSVRIYADARACVADAGFVILSIRAGGIDARARDEATVVQHGVVGQETVGPAGFAMAVRNIPHAIEYARLIGREAPRAWVISFTNPVGIVTQAMTTATNPRVIGICDTPAELFADVAQVLALDSARCSFDYFGLNHLGWLREVYCDGAPQLSRVWNDPTLLARIYRRPLFDPGFLGALRLLPTEYLFYYYRPDTALENTRRSGQTRGGAIAQLNEQLFRDLRANGVDRRRVYERYLEARSAGYMQLESGSAQALPPSRHADLTGYDKIALAVIRAIHFNSNAIIPLDVPNRGALRDLADADVVEVPCVVNANGAHPLTIGPVPDAVRDLLVRVKEYERLTLDAAATRSGDVAIRALSRNPLVGDDNRAQRLIDALQPLW